MCGGNVIWAEKPPKTKNMGQKKKKGQRQERNRLRKTPKRKGAARKKIKLAFLRKSKGQLKRLWALKREKRKRGGWVVPNRNTTQPKSRLRLNSPGLTYIEGGGGGRVRMGGGAKAK